MAKIGIVTVLYNSASVIEDYFKTLSEQTYKDFVLYIIDNKSPDNSLFLSKKLAEKYKKSFDSIIIENDKNYGVAKGNNIGIKQAKNDGCEYILLSNNDIELKKDCIESCIKKYMDENPDMLVPKIYFYDEPLIWYAGGDFKWIAGTIRQWGYLLKDDNPLYSKSKYVDYAPTCFMLIRSSLFDKIGYFDEKYFVYYDDTDWVYRCIKAGKKLYYFADTCLWHKESTSTGGMKSDFYLHYANRNKIYFCIKNYGIIKKILALFAIQINYYLFVRPRMNSHQRAIIKKSYIEGFKMRSNE